MRSGEGQQETGQDGGRGCGACGGGAGSEKVRRLLIATGYGAL